jgi:PBP1b-binding outer membrane lipoprotein LpoB
MKNGPNTNGTVTMAALLGLVMLITGCAKSTHVTTKAGGHEIRAEIVGNHSIDTQPDRGTISSSHGTVTIERTRVKVDDADWTTIPEGVPVEVSISKGTVRLAAGKVTIKRTVN